MLLNVKFSKEFSSFNAKFETINNTIKPQFIEVQKISTGTEDLEKYKGAIEVIPSVKVEQVLETASKWNENDITIKKIPYFEVSNNSGGITATIGG